MDTTAAEKQAIEEAFADAIKQEFGFLMTELTVDNPAVESEQLLERFRSGLAIARRARAEALKAVEKGVSDAT
jgi:ABC-type transporter MlaC component